MIFQNVVELVFLLSLIGIVSSVPGSIVIKEPSHRSMNPFSSRQHLQSTGRKILCAFFFLLYTSEKFQDDTYLVTYKKQIFLEQASFFPLFVDQILLDLLFFFFVVQIVNILLVFLLLFCLFYFFKKIFHLLLRVLGKN